MTAPTTSPATVEWGADRLDLDAYLERIGYAAGPDGPEPDARTLRGLHRAHAAAIPFENLDVVLGRGVSLDFDDVQRKLVGRRRGGYCYEHNLLFAAVLERLGYAVTRLAARVQPARNGPRTHMLLRVAVDGAPWLADVGFGASLLEPLPLQEATVRHGGWTYRLRATGRDRWLLEQDKPDGWTDLYEFTLEPQRPIDYAVYNHYTATHPRSPFVGQVVVLRTEPAIRHELRGRRLSAIRPDGTTETWDVTDEALSGLLAELFGIELDDADVERVARRLS